MILIFQLIHALILWRLEFFLYPELLIYPYLTAKNVIPYAQILDQHFPGLMFFPINFHTLGFQDPVSFKALLILIIIIQSFFIYRFTRSRLSVFLFTLWQPLFEGNQLWLDTFLPLILLPAFVTFLSGHLFVTGILLGLGVVFKQTLVPVVAYVGLVLLFKKRFRQLFIFSIGALIPSIVMLLYYLDLGVIADFWYWTVQFNLTVFAAHGRNSPSINEAVKVLFIGLIGLYLFIRYPKTRHLLMWGLLGSLETFSRFGLIHLQPLIPFVAISAMFLKKSRKVAMLVIISSLAWFGYFLVREPNLGQYRYFDSQTLQIIGTIKDRTDPGDKIFLLGVQPHIYQQTQTLPPGNVFVFQFPWFLQISGARVLQTLKDDPPKLVLYNPESNIDEQHLRDYASYLVEYTQEYYKLVDQIGDTHIYESRN